MHLITTIYVVLHQFWESLLGILLFQHVYNVFLKLRGTLLKVYSLQLYPIYCFSLHIFSCVVEILSPKELILPCTVDTGTKQIFYYWINNFSLIVVSQAIQKTLNILG